MIWYAEHILFNIRVAPSRELIILLRIYAQLQTGAHTHTSHTHTVTPPLHRLKTRTCVRRAPGVAGVAGPPKTRTRPDATCELAGCKPPRFSFIAVERRRARITSSGIVAECVQTYEINCTVCRFLSSSADGVSSFCPCPVSVIFVIIVRMFGMV